MPIAQWKVKKVVTVYPVTEYQSWDNYPDSPVLTENYPFQVAGDQGGSRGLLYSAAPFYRTGFNITSNSAVTWMANTGASWALMGTYPAMTPFGFSFANTDIIAEANNDVYTDSTLGTVFFEKTTLGGETLIQKILIRIG